jgi:hypothetical protein
MDGKVFKGRNPRRAPPVTCRPCRPQQVVREELAKDEVLDGRLRLELRRPGSGDLQARAETGNRDEVAAMPKKGVKKYKCVLYFEIVYCAAGAFCLNYRFL